jgi:hypothetical protein
MNDMKQLLAKALLITGLVLSVCVTASFVMAAPTSNFQQTIGAGTIAVDIVNASYETVASPGVTFTPTTFSFACNTSTGTFGTATEQIYVSNPDAADAGWTVSIAASAGATGVWASAGPDIDFNDPNVGGCTDGADADALAGKMIVDPSGGSIAQGASGNGVEGVSAGSKAEYNQGTTDSITLLVSDGTTDIGDWTFQGIDISQTIPAEQPAASDYAIEMTISILASS